MPTRIVQNEFSSINGYLVETVPGTSPTTFDQKFLDVSIKLASGSGVPQPSTFSASGTNTVTLQNYRVSARVRNAGNPSGGEATIDIYGMSLDLMNQLSTLGIVVTAVPRNTLTLSARSTRQTTPSTVFTGTILQAYGDFDASPNVPFRFECKTAKAEDVLPAQPSSYPGQTDVATIFSNLAQKMNLGFENSGVNRKIANAYLPGTLGRQYKTMAAQLGIEAEIVNGGTVLAIWPRGQARNTALVTFSPGSGMIGYPSYTQQGIMVRSVYNPNVGFGGKIAVANSILKRANGEWIVIRLDHSLDSLVNEGKWESTIFAQGTKVPYPIVTPVR